MLARESFYSRQQLARLVKVSVRTLDRYFQTHLSMNVAGWLRELQLADAYNLVVSGTFLKEVAFNVGFKQPSHFSRCFKARFGLPPSALFEEHALN